MFHALNEMKTGKSSGPSEISLELMAASWRVMIQVMAEIYQRIIDGFGMPFELALSIMVSIFKGKG